MIFLVSVTCFQATYNIVKQDVQTFPYNLHILLIFNRYFSSDTLPIQAANNNKIKQCNDKPYLPNANPSKKHHFIY